MRKYYIPPTIKEKEKIIGGILTLGQFAFLITGLVIGIVLAVFIFVITDSIEMAIILFLTGLSSGVPFAFYKKNGLTLLQYIKYKRKFVAKEKKLPKRRVATLNNNLEDELNL